ncbi:MAG: RagB/SusD family nutrient uptake outer membrane protein [Gemmatimonas sp.]|nr:RagB/SusD family nutrient uptake outer membrane protein [Gemmatimonas sp.]
MINRIVSRSAALGCLCVLAAGCDLEQNPVSATDATSVFGTEAGLELYSNSFYEVLPEAEDIYHGDTMTDYAAVRGVSEFLRPGAYSPTSRGSWSWDALRNINFFLLHNEGPEVPQPVRDHYNGLARFYRAVFYFDKVKTYGDVPWIDRPLDLDDEQQFAGRDSREMVMDHVLEDLDHAIANISLETDASRTRITKDVALAWKSRIALFEGTFRKYHAGGLAAGLEDTADFWLQQAADAAEQVMARGTFTLHQGGGENNSYRELFSSEMAPASETLLVYPHDVNLGIRHRANWVYTSATTGAGFSFVRPFIHTYLNIDGTPFTDRPGYETTTFMEEVVGRDKRLQQTIRLGDFTRVSAGVEIPSPPLFSQTLTGYHPIKWTVDDIGVDAGNNNTNDIPIFRYAEVLLNYAEAKAELGTLTAADWAQTIGALRARAGITGGLTSLPSRADPYLQSTYFPDVTDPVILEVRRERGVELATEGLRFYDIVRWKRGELMEMPWRGFYVPSVDEHLDLNEDGTPDVYFHLDDAPADPIQGVFYLDVSGDQRTLSEGSYGELEWMKNVRRVWEDKLYLYPIAEADLAVNPGLEQNPGW